MTPAVLNNSNGILTFSAGQWRCPETAGVLLGHEILEVCDRHRRRLAELSERKSESAARSSRDK